MGASSCSSWTVKSSRPWALLQNQASRWPGIAAGSVGGRAGDSVMDSILITAKQPRRAKVDRSSL